MYVLKKSNFCTPFEANTQNRFDASYGVMTTTRIRQGLFPNDPKCCNTEAPILLTNSHVEKNIKLFIWLARLVGNERMKPYMIMMGSRSLIPY